MQRPAQPVAQHTKTALPQPGEGSDPFAAQRHPTPSGTLDVYLLPGKACRNSSTSTRWFSE
ncbi:hypothetical protein STPA111741_16650 [Stenotrophomonas pavanii]